MPLIEPAELVPAAQVGPVHFVAIGGAGMSGIASAYAALGVPTSGSDQADSATLRALAGEGIATWVGHDPEHLGDARTVVVSTAVRESNVELAAARARGLRVWHRSAALGALMLGRRGVAVTGTHGKTTTSGMVAAMLVAAEEDPSYVIGSPLASTGRSAALGAGPAFVVEADESDGSFLQYPAQIVVVTNVEADHLDNWGTAEAYADGFVRLGLLPAVQLVVACADDPGARAVAERLRAAGRRVLAYGEGPDADVRVTDVAAGPEGASATLSAASDSGPVELAVPGRFNVLNAAAAYAVGLELLGADAGPRLRAALGSFRGTARRMEAKGEAGGVRVLDDYAHHPTEVTATLEALRSRVGGGRLVACFQPHLYSRTAELADAFGEALTLADVVLVCGIYGAREDPVPGVSGRLVADAVAARGHQVEYVEAIGGAPAALAGLVRPGDLVATLGAGDVTTVGPALVALLGERS